MGKMHKEGFTLIEMLVTLSVVGIVVAFGVPAMRDFMDTNRMSAATNDLVSNLHYARSEAVKRGTTTRLCPSADWAAENPVCNAAGTLADGWLIVVDPDGAAIVVQQHEPLPDRIRLKDNLNSWIDYTATGEPDLQNPQAEFNILLCDDRESRDMGNGLAAGRLINVRGPGRPRIYTRNADVQTALGGCNKGS